MAKIKQLSAHEAQKIAAGEVVERPANIVKELVENSIDAGATRISIYIEDAGKQLIRIVDNGCGMDTTDAQICFDRHATSKITCVDELESINTFGFRGEALASIAAVSKIVLITKEEHSLEGTQITVEANTIAHADAVACVTGTDISVHNLFFNVPARKKFLKAPQTEIRAIQLLFNAFCFDYPHIHFTLFLDGKQINNCPVTHDIKNRALQLWESSTHKHLLTIHTHDKKLNFTLEGVISDHQQYRYDRSSIYFFVNKRWVKNQHLGSALIKGYANVIPHGRYPIAAINITVPANEVDINIHPRKEEVKFLHPRRIEQALQEVVKAALENNLSQHLHKDVTIKSTTSSAYTPQERDFKPFDFGSFFASSTDQNTLNNNLDMPPFDPFLQTKRFPNHANPEPIERSERFILQPAFAEASAGAVRHSSSDGGQVQNERVEDFVQNSLTSLDIEQIPLALSVPKGDVSKGSEFRESYRLIGQYKTTYLLVEKEDGLFLVDQHAAHERILYELFSERFKEVATIQLLFPQIITLTEHDIDIITPHLDIFTHNGIIVEQCASNQLIVQSLPVHLKDQSLTDIIKETISWVTEYASFDTELFKKTINNKLQAQMACKAAIKAGDMLTQEKMEQLLRDLEKTANRFSCPHGRPTGWLLSLNEIEKKFKRKL